LLPAEVLAVEPKSHVEIHAVAADVNLSPRLIRIKAAATYLGLSTWSVRNLVQSGKLPVIFGDGTYAPWRFDVWDLDAYIEQQKVWL
jgi:excisionase family DNA binding protein